MIPTGPKASFLDRSGLLNSLLFDGSRFSQGRWYWSLHFHLFLHEYIFGTQSFYLLFMLPSHQLHFLSHLLHHMRSICCSSDISFTTMLFVIFLVITMRVIKCLLVPTVGAKMLLRDRPSTFNSLMLVFRSLQSSSNPMLRGFDCPNCSGEDTLMLKSVIIWIHVY